MRWSLGFRLQALLLTLVPLAFLILLLALTLVLVSRAEISTSVAEHSAAVLGRADALSRTLTEGNRSVAAFGRTGREADLTSWRKTPATVRTQAAALLAVTSDDPQLHADAEHYIAAVDRALEILRRYVDATAAHDQKKAAAIETEPQTQRLGATLTTTKAVFDDTEKSRTLVLLHENRSTLNHIQAAMMITAVVGILATIVVATLFGLLVVRRLEILAANARRIAAGKPTVHVSGSDEIAELDRVYSDMTANLMQTHNERQLAVAALERERNVASTLQKALLPNRLPEIAGLRFDAAYVTPSDGPEIGGDWFDVFQLNDRYVGMSVGDVAGHGLRAAVTMGSMRQSIRAAARITRVPSLVLAHANRMICLDEPGTLVTAFYGVLDRTLRTFTYALAGHPAPVVIELDGTLTSLAGSGIMLGIDPEATFDDGVRQFDSGNAFVLYTDGLVEARRDYLAGMTALYEAIDAETHNPALNMADGIQARVFDGISPQDDSAVLVVSFVQGGADETEGSLQSWRFDARDAAATHRTRRAVVMHLEDCVPAAYRFNIEVIVGEILSNIARHTPGPAQIISERRGGSIVVHFEDDGESYTIDNRREVDLLAESGRGIALVRSLSNALALERTERGNRLSVTLPGVRSFLVEA